jgi:hypothetical protein
MSYLSGPRLHFSGTFTTDVSTENNFVTHFKDINNPNQPGWNPSGSGAWSISGCTIRGAVFKDGTVARSAADDPVIGASLAQIGRARLVDLDPEQQLVSEIWGLRLRLVSSTGVAAATGDFKVAPFSDIWGGRFTANGNGDFAMTAFYQSLMTGVAWGDLFGSRFMGELKQASDPTLLSIKFNVDGFDQTRHVGRIVGTIGPASASEPAHFVVGRQCMGLPQGPVGYFPAIVDAGRKKLIADFGNALPTTSFRGPLDPTLNLELGIEQAGQFTSIGSVRVGPTGWYEQTAGVCEFPADRPFSDAELGQLATAPIVVRQQGAVVAREGVDGLHVRADDFVYRMSANDVVNVSLRVSKFGQPLPNAEIALAFDPSQLQEGDGDPDVDQPQSGVQFPPRVVTDGQGIATLPLSAKPIGRPRDYIDGQVYGVRYTLPQSNPDSNGYVNSSDFVSILVWSDFAAPNVPDWNTHVEPILSQYQKLYSVMKNIVDLGSYPSVVASKDQMKDVFSRPQTDPRYMPVTRDLSPAKRNMILRWLDTTGNAGQPNLGPAPVVVASAALAEAGAPLAMQRQSAAPAPSGKSVALGRKIGSYPKAAFQKGPT